ncbi:hypothetical protein [Clostridium sp. C8-1-8]|uniref:hypothetical protein n=1 Tax=Clostridium sp. C8-1-8 TaxID=2698831 RepID=UPI00136F0484|nr:hypothetical protein [Clostridium sp. C8-1-8]
MKKTGKIISITGGIIGLVLAIAFLTFGLIAFSRNHDFLTMSVIIGAVVMILLSIIGIVLGIISGKYPRASSAILILLGFIGFTFGYFYIISSILFIISAIITLISKTSEKDS